MTNKEAKHARGVQNMRTFRIKKYTEFMDGIKGKYPVIKKNGFANFDQ